MKQKDVYLLLIPSFIIIVFWVIFTVYHNSVTSTISENLNTTITQIDPNFDTKTIDELKGRTQVKPVYEMVPQQNTEENNPIEAPQQASEGGTLLP